MKPDHTDAWLEADWRSEALRTNPCVAPAVGVLALFG